MSKRITYEGPCDVVSLRDLLSDLISVGDVIGIQAGDDSVVVTVVADMNWERREMLDRAVDRASGRAPMPKRRGRKI